MNNKKPTIDEYLELSPQLQRYYRVTYPELNYPLAKNYKNKINKPTLEEFNALTYHKKKKWRELYPTEYPQSKKYNYEKKN